MRAMKPPAPPVPQAPSQARLEAAYRYCLDMARTHYENFPVASWLLPKHLRRPVAVIYAFARSADDFADEGDLDEARRLRLLDEYETRLDQIEANKPVDQTIFVALTDVIRTWRLDIQLFRDLLRAFRQDVTKTRYANFDEVLDYCRHSANPVGRLLLQLYRLDNAENSALSDAVCSALQLINFHQDIYQDANENDRVYLPQDELGAAGLSVSCLRERINDAAMREFMHAQNTRARKLMLQGAPLGRVLPGRMGFELRMTIHGGLRVLDRLDAAADVFARPRLRLRDWGIVLVRALLR